MADDWANFIGDTASPLFTFEPFHPPELQTQVAPLGVVEIAGDRDVFAVPLTAGVTYKFFILGGPVEPALPDSLLRLLDSAGTQIDADNGNANRSEIVFMPKTSGTYYLEVSGASAGVTGSYLCGGEQLDLFTGAAEITFSSIMGIPLDSDTLPQFAQTQFTHGQQIGVASPTVYMYEALGLALAEGAPALQSILSPANLPDPDFVGIVYGTVFGIQPNAAQVQVFISQLDFFESIYVASGAFGQDITRIDILARGAVIGQMLGVYADNANNNAPAAIVGASATMDFDLL